ncbi:hypothetical protein LTR66_001957 [Elasticomyces elasticus]|nr:hypothetical protein LTR66_001957 [Elasticomyces elasticus]
MSQPASAKRKPDESTRERKRQKASKSALSASVPSPLEDTQAKAPDATDAFSDDPKVLINAVEAAETSGNLHCYLRCFALAQLAQQYRDTCSNGGTLPTANQAQPRKHKVITKHDKAAAHTTFIEHIWGVPFPAQYRGDKCTKKGLINATNVGAPRWNKCITRLLTQPDAGHRWQGLAEKVGWSSLGLIASNWSIGDGKVTVTDATLEQTLTKTEYDKLVDEVLSTKGRFLRSMDKVLAGDLFNALKDSPST